MARGVFVTDRAQVRAFDAVFAEVFGARERPAGADPTPRTTQPSPRADERPRRPQPRRARDRRTSGDRTRRAAGRRRRRGAARRRGARGGQRRGGAALEALRRAAPGELAHALPADGAARGGHPAAAHAPLRARPPRRADRHAPDPSRQPAHRRRPDPARAPAPPRGAPAHGAAVRHLGLDGALRARVPPVPDLRRRQRARRRGIRVRHAAHPPDPRAALAQPGARDPARRRGRARLVERHAHRRRAEGVQRPPRAARHGARRRGRDPLRRLGARRPRARRRARWSACRASPTGSCG